MLIDDVSHRHGKDPVGSRENHIQSPLLQRWPPRMIDDLHEHEIVPRDGCDLQRPDSRVDLEAEIDKSYWGTNQDQKSRERIVTTLLYPLNAASVPRVIKRKTSVVRCNHVESDM